MVAVFLVVMHRKYFHMLQSWRKCMQKNHEESEMKCDNTHRSDATNVASYNVNHSRASLPAREPFTIWTCSCAEWRGIPWDFPSLGFSEFPSCRCGAAKTINQSDVGIFSLSNSQKKNKGTVSNTARMRCASKAPTLAIPLIRPHSSPIHQNR